MEPDFFLKITFMIIGYGLLFSINWRVAMGIFFLNLAGS